MNATSEDSPGLGAMSSIAMSLGCAGLLTFWGASAGAHSAPAGLGSGWIDTRSWNVAVDALLLGCCGMFVGLLGGFFLGRFLAGLSLAVAVPVSLAFLAAPVILYTIQQGRAERGRLALMEQTVESHSQETLDRAAVQKSLVASSQYVSTVDQNVATVDRLRAEIMPVTYPSSRFVSSPTPRQLVFDTNDSFDAVQSFFKAAPVTQEAQINQSVPAGRVYYRMGSMTAAISFETSQSPPVKTTIIYDIAGT